MKAREIAARFGGGKRPVGKFNGADVWACKCPVHGDDRSSNDSLHLWDGDGGSLGAKCHGGCSYQAVLDATGVEFTYEGRRHVYGNGNGGHVERRRGPGKDLSGNPGTNIGLLVKLAADDVPENACVLAEGEKAFDGLVFNAPPGYTAAHWVGGSGSVEHADYTPLEGRKVFLWPDAGQQGRDVMATAAIQLSALPGGVAKLWMVDTEELPEKADAADVDKDTMAKMLQSAYEYEPKAQPKQLEDVKLSGIPPWVVIGDYYAAKHWQGKARYVRGNAGAPVWWAYANKIWRPLLLEKDHAIHHHLDRQRFSIAQGLVDTGESAAAKLLSNPREWRAERTTYAGEFWAGMAQTLAGDEPRPRPGCFAAANVHVDLATGITEPHAAEHGTRSLASGRYLPDDAARLDVVLQARFKGILSPAGIAGFIDLMALGMTGQAQSYKAVLWLWGVSGSGKGGVLKLIDAAFGDKALSRTRSFLEHTQGDIDDALADVLEKQPLFILIDEVGASKKAMNEGRALSRFGDAPQSARRPHGRTITGPIRAMLVLTTVAAPALSGKMGWERRSAVLGTLEKIPTGRKAPHMAQSLLDAVVTLAALRAREVLQELADGKYEEPVGDPEKVSEFLSEADPVAYWLESLPDSCDGMKLADLAEKANAELDHERAFTAASISRKVGISDRWRRFQPAGQTQKCIQLRRQQPQLEMDTEIYCIDCAKVFNRKGREDQCPACENLHGGEGGPPPAGDVARPSAPAPTSPAPPPPPVDPLSLAVSARLDALMATKTPDGRPRMVSVAESKAAAALGGLLDVGPDDILTPWHVSQLADVDRLVQGIEAAAVVYPIGEWADWRSVLHEAAVLIEEDAQKRKPAPDALQGRVANLWVALQPKLPLGD